MTLEQKTELAALIEKDIKAIGSIYPSFGEALYDEPLKRLAQRTTTTFEKYLREQIMQREKKGKKS